MSGNKMETTIKEESLIPVIKSFNLMDLLPKALNIEPENFKISPSEFIREMSLTTEERHKKSMHITNTQKLLHRNYPSFLKILPHMVIFQKFEPKTTYSVILQIINIGKSLAPIKMRCPDSEYFSATVVGSTTNRIASGLSVDYEIRFTPKLAHDYSHFLVFKSGDETFELPITAIGLRPMLDIPDQIVFNVAPVKIPTNKFIIVRNIGGAPAVFNFITQSNLFHVNPSKGILESYESMILNISFEPKKIGEVSEPLILSLETGEKLTIMLHASAENVCVRLDKNCVVHDDTFMGLKRCKSIRLINGSSSVLKFSWKKYMTRKEELAIIESLKEKYKELSDIEIIKECKVKFYELNDSKTHKAACERILEDELHLLEKEEFKFSHETFSFMPESGEVWPNSFSEIIITFEPKICGTISAEAYLEVTGRDSRLPVKIKGIGLGPKIVLNTKTLDINYIYLCSCHRYEVIAVNRGDISGTIQFLAEPLVFGGKVEVSPQSRHLEPGECAAFVITFTSNRQGEFIERLTFIIKESCEKVCLIFKGKIISPTLHFDIRQVNFGTVPVGFPTTREVTLNNLSMVPVTFYLRVLVDGNVPSLSVEQFAKLTIKPPLPASPKEFFIEPEESVVEPFSSKKVTLTLTANRSGKFMTYLMVDMWDSESGSVSCPVHFHPKIANITIDPDTIAIPFCFINFPYTRSITLKNVSKIPGYFYIVPPEPNDQNSITCSANIPQGIIEPNSSVKIDITIMTSSLGRQITPVSMIIFGNAGPREMFSISCNGQGPLVTVNPDALNWGDVELLEEVQKTIDVVNESPIPASVSISIAKSKSPWTVSPSEFTLEPSESKTVTVSLLLNDRGKYKTVLKVNVYNGKVSSVPLTAVGVGSSLKMTPNISPNYDMGKLFSHKKYEVEIELENKGCKPYGLVWSPFPEYKTFANMKLVNPPELVFRIEPPKFDLCSGEKKIMILEVESKSNGYFHQTFYCFANIGVPVKELHLISEVFAEFVEPHIKFDKTEMKYWYNVGCEGTEQKLTDEVQISNTSVLPVSINLAANYPFSIETDSGELTNNYEMYLEGNETKLLTVRFLIEESEDKYSRVFRENLAITFQGHSKNSFISLVGETNYPNISVIPQKINFGYVAVGASVYKEISIVNVSPLTVHYEVQWNLKKCIVEYICKTEPGWKEQETLLEIEGIEECENVSESESENIMEEEDVISSKEIVAPKPSEISQRAVLPPKPVAKMPEITVSKSDIKAELFPLTRNYYKCDDELVEAYRMARSSEIEGADPVLEIAQMCDITPFYGKLEPFSSQTLAVRFSTETEVELQLESQVKVLFGPTEMIAIEGRSGYIDFHLSQVEFDFGKQLFCDTKTKTLKVQNIAVMPFSYETVIDNLKLCDMRDDLPLGKGALTVKPHTGNVNSYSGAELSIRYRPGVPGKFEDKFQLQIAYLNPIMIRIKGIAVFPQVQISLPRPDLANIQPEIGYLAVTNITPDWFLTEMSKLTEHNFFSVKAYRSRESNLESLTEVDDMELIIQGWEIISRYDIAPSDVDIQLAIERELAFELISREAQNNATFAMYSRTIPDFYVPAYELDFGVVVTGQTKEQIIAITNYGPLPAVIYGIFDPHLKEEGIHIRLKNKSELKIGSSLQFTASFHPKKSKYRQKFEEVKDLFHFEIYRGARIPIHVFGIVTYPHIIASMNELNFCEVTCGCCKVMNFKIKNPGLVPAMWTMTFSAKIENFRSLSDGGIQDGSSMFFLSQNSGSLDPGEYSNVQISFKPNAGGTFAVALNIHVAKGLEEIKIMLLGEGIEPKLKIIKRTLNFGPTLPYPNTLENTFFVENPCSFPIELYFPIFDEQIFEEEKILRIVCDYYQTKQLLLPVRKPGDGLPPELINFYHTMLDELNAKFIEQEREKELNEENASTIMLSEDDFLVSSSNLSFPERRKKRMRKALSRSKTSVETSRINSALIETSTEQVSTSIFDKKSAAEIEEMLSDYVRNLAMTEATYDPIQAALKSTLPPPQEEEYKEGFLVIFHGAPFTNSVQLANRASLITGMNVLSINRIVLEEAVSGRFEAGLAVKDLIEQAYWDYVEEKSTENDDTRWGEEGEPEANESCFSKDFAEIQRKFEALKDLRENLINSKTKGPNPSSAKSEASKKLEKVTTPILKPMSTNLPIANIDEELVAEILKQRLSLEVAQGLIIEGLSTEFISTTTKALITILKAAGNVSDILMIFLLNNYLSYNQLLVNKRTEQEMAKEKLREELLKILEEEPEEVFYSLHIDPDEAELIHSLFISRRHEENHLFEKQKEKFYDMKKIVKTTEKKNVTFPVLSLGTSIDSSPEKSQKTKKDKDKKRENEKVAKTAEISGRKTGSEAKAGKVKRDLAEGEFLAFELELIEMKSYLENWDQRIGGPVVEVVMESKFKKGYTPRKQESQLVTKPNNSRGIFLWLVDATKPESKVFNSVCCRLKTILEERLAPSESDSWPLTSTDFMIFSVVTYPLVRKKQPVSDVFSMIPTETILTSEDTFEDSPDFRFSSSTINAKLNRSVSQISFKSKRKACVARRRKIDSKMSLEAKSMRSKKSNSITLPEDQRIKSRWILHPGESITCRVKYFPMDTGRTDQFYSVNLVNWNNGDVIHCIGLCDIPSLDTTPEVMFPKISHFRPLTSPQSPSYFLSDETYDFGSIIMVQSNEPKTFTQKSATFKLRNNSSMPVDLNIVSANDVLAGESSNSRSVKFEPEKALLEPGKDQPLTVTANPTKIGPTTESIMFFVKDNPKVESIKVKFEGVKPNVTVEPKIVNFDRLLLHRKEFRRVVFTNNNAIPLYISLVGHENLPSQFTLSHTSGLISPLSAFMTDISYEATEIQLISEQPIQVKVFDDASAKEPVQEISFAISVEAYDAALDIIFATKEDDHIDFGDIRVDNNCVYVFNIRNMGKYPLGFKIDIDYQLLPEGENEEFSITPREGKLAPSKMLPLTVSYKAQNEVVWKRLPILKILLVEPYSSDELIATIPIQVSVRSFFARFELKPQKDFNFGQIKIATTATGSLLIENKGHFSLAYTIQRDPSEVAVNVVDDMNKKSFKPTASSKEKGDKGKKANLSVLTVGVFEISPSSGIAESGQIAVVQITFSPSEIKFYEEKVVIMINECLPHLKNGSELIIAGEGCIPQINFDDVKSVFREHFICKTEFECNYPEKHTPHTMYIESTSFLLFKNVNLSKTHEARIHLSNVGLIDCYVKAVVSQSTEEEESRTSVVASLLSFDVSPSRLIIEPYSSGVLTVTFLPEAIDVFKARLIITLEMPVTMSDVVRIIELSGNGILPEVEITEPNSKLPDGNTLVHFPSSCPGHSSSTSIAFSNVGPIDCKVIVEIYKYQEGVFTLIPKENTKNKLKIWELSKPIDHTVIVSISPGESAEFNVYFCPKEIQSYTSQIKLFVVDNPFKNLSYKLIGEVVVEEVVIERIRTRLPFLDDDPENSEKSLVFFSPGQYILNFGDCYVNKKSKALLKLVNKTEKDFFKFDWEEIPNVSISPSVGHLYPNTYKEILLIFQPEEPVEVEDAPIVCRLNKILMEYPPDVSWDSRLIQYQKCVRGDSTSNRNNEIKDSSPTLDSATVKVSGEEPEFEIIPETSKYLTVILSGIADYARLLCETTKIIFKNTFMFQSRIYPLVLENPGNVAVEYNVKLKSLTVTPLKEDKEAQVSETSFLKLKRRQSRPQSSLLSYSRSSQSSQWNEPPVQKCKRPRPLTSVSLLDLKKEFSNESSPDELKPLPEEPKTPAHNPFSVENTTGKIPPKETVSCNIIFSPVDINEYKAVIIINVPYLHPEYTLPEIEVTASSVMPYCHFNIPESDYLESGRRDFSRPGPIGYSPGIPLSPETKTIEIKVLGIDQAVPLQFHVINPTEEDYTFSWINVTQTQPNVVPSFHCSTTDGRIQSGRQQLMIFNFISQKIGITESFWKFCIPKYGVETPFLFVCNVHEPAVYCVTNHLNMRPTIIGSTSTDYITLVNHEDASFDFYFIHESLYAEGRANSLKIEPLNGTIPPHSEVNARVIFTGKTGGKLLFYVKCKIKGLKEPLTISVDVTTYVVQPLIAFEDLKKVKHYAEAGIENVIDFGTELNPNHPETITLVLNSLSKTSFYYEWEYNKTFLESKFCRLRFSVKNGHVVSFSRGKCEVTIVFSRKSSLINFPVKLKIKKGPTYNFVINAAATTPVCEFSFSSYDFGYCFLQEKDISYYEVSLAIRNKDLMDLVLESTLSEISAFSYSLPQAIVPPGKDITIPIQFHPKECIPYTDVLKFTLNGLHEKLVSLKGHGTEFKVSLANPQDTTISLGAVRAGKTSIRKFSLINKSLASVSLIVGFLDQFPISGIYLLNQKENNIDLSKNHRLSKLITISPSTLFTIKPQESFGVMVTYAPSHRSAQFSETVAFQFQERVEPLCILTGCCLGPEISLDRQYLNFGAVVETCSSTLKLKIVNSGNIGARFEWHFELPDKEYFVSPSSGYCSPESDVTIQVTFKPLSVQSNIKRKVECKLFLSEHKNYPSLHLNLTGDCVTLPYPSETVSFKCFVREIDTKTLSIDNISGNEWQLLPVITGEYFKGHDALIIPSMSSEEYDINYCPLTMTNDGVYHEGSVFFRLPNGNGLLYQLQGISMPPNPEDVIVREVPCKTKYSELLKVKNWMQYSQRFKVEIENVSSDSKENLVWTCNGYENLEVPALMQKEYSLNFFSYKTGSLEFHVKFVNEDTKEYIWYDITFNIVMCGPLEIIAMKTGVRQTCHHEIKLENPLKQPIQFLLDTTSHEIHFKEGPYTVPPEETIYVNISFTPIHSKETIEKLNASCPQLGVFPRELRLTSVEVQPELAKTFQTSLGTSLSQDFEIKNISQTNAELTCTIDSEEFVASGQTNVAAGQSRRITVTYEPSEIGSTTATFYVLSEQAGNFVFPLIGICLKPLPKGPFVVKPGKEITIPFKNVLKAAKDFFMYVDNPAFVLKTTQENILPKTIHKINLALQKVKNLEKSEEYTDIEPRFPIGGQLIVECFNPYIKWQFYLKGVLDEPNP